MKPLFRHGCALIALVVAGLALQAHAQEFRVGFVNTDRILKESAAAKAASAGMGRRSLALNAATPFA